MSTPINITISGPRLPISRRPTETRRFVVFLGFSPASAQVGMTSSGIMTRQVTSILGDPDPRKPTSVPSPTCAGVRARDGAT